MRALVLTLALMAAFWLGGMRSPTAWAAEKPSHADKTPAAAVGKSQAPAAAAYRYSSAGKPDPFRPFMETDPAVIKKLEEEAQRRKAARMRASVSPLQQAEINAFRLVGIIGDAATRKAVVVDRATKRFYTLVVGIPIGPNGGRVSAIERDRVIVTEPLQTAGRKKETKLVTMRLYKEEEGKP